MAKIRIYELARELEMDNKAILEMCTELEITGKKSHSNALSDTEADKIRRHVLRSTKVDRDSERVVKREGQVVTEKRVSGNVIRRRKKDSKEPEVQEELVEPQLETVSEAEEEVVSEQQVSEEPAHVESLSEEGSSTEEISAEASANQEESVETDISENEETVSSEDSDTTNEIEALRKKLDVRAPKILGKIDLPTKPAHTAKDSSGSDTDGFAESQEGSGGGRRKKGKKGGHDTSRTEDERDRRKKRRKQVLSKGDLLDYDGEREMPRGRREKKNKKPTIDPLSEEAIASRAGKKPIKIDGEITVGELARKMGLKAAQVIPELMKLGSMAGINHLIDYETAELIATTFGFETQNIETSVEDMFAELHIGEDKEGELRPPVVTVMGHVDHGKTSLLDAIRKTSVTEGEAGGITQHIGAYNVKLDSGGSVTFLDTPGHEAFTSMRSRGAQITDIVVLVVAADDGVMPQTIEAINHAQAAEVPIIVAVNKMDKEGANPEKVINQLAEHGLVPEDWGGDTLIVKVSAINGDGIDELLETLHLQAEVLELKAVEDRPATGAVVESKIDKGKGAVLTVLVRNGTLKKGDTFVAGSVSGKIRALMSHDGKAVEEAGPSIPVEILGASTAAVAGDDFVVTKDESQAKLIADERALKLRKKEFVQTSKTSAIGMPLTMERFSEALDSGEMKTLPLVVKVDVQGSLEAVVGSLSNLSNEEVEIKIIHKGVGAITENDVQLASASNAVIVAFNVRPDSRAQQVIEEEGVSIEYSRVIYEIVDAIEQALKGRMAPKFVEKSLARVEVRETFRVPKLGMIAGSYVLDGSVERNANVRLLRDGKVVHEGKMASLRRFKDDVKEVQAGYECGIGIEGYGDIKNGDIIEVFKVEEVRVS